MQKHQELRDCIAEIFSGGSNKKSALIILQHELEHLDVPDGVIDEIVALCEQPLINTDGIEPILNNLMEQIELYCETFDARNLAGEFSKFCSNKVKSGSRHL